MSKEVIGYKSNIITIQLGDICDLKNGFAFKSEDYIEISETMNFRMSQIRPGGRIDLDHSGKYLPDSYAEIYKDYLLKDNDIVIAMTDMASDTKILGVPTLVKTDGRKLLLNQRVGKLFNLISDAIYTPYLRYILTSPQVYSYYKTLGKGGVQINLGKSDILNAVFPLSPLPEQRAIVAKLEKLFSELDNGIANFKKAQEQLKVYRQAVLKKAFEGELTKTWREQQTNLPTAEELLAQIKTERENHFQKQLDDWKQAVKEWEAKGKEGKKPAKPKKSKELPPITEEELADLPILPKSWKWVRISQISNAFGGYAFKSKDFKETGKYQVIKMANVKMGNINLKSRPAFLNEVSNEIIDKYGLLSGDCLITLTGTRKKRDYGFVALVIKEKDLLLNQRLAGIRFCKPILPEYFQYSLRDRHFQDNFFKYETGNVGQGNVGMKPLVEETIAMPSVSEQQQIVQEIESRLSVCDKVEETIKESLIKAEALRQSILKKAFAGKLLSAQELEACRLEPDWEPAEKLLERIKAEKRQSITN